MAFTWDITETIRIMAGSAVLVSIVQAVRSWFAERHAAKLEIACARRTSMAEFERASSQFQCGWGHDVYEEMRRGASGLVGLFDSEVDQAAREILSRVSMGSDARWKQLHEQIGTASCRTLHKRR